MALAVLCSFLFLFGKPNNHFFDVQRLPAKRNLGNSSEAGSSEGRACCPRTNSPIRAAPPGALSRWEPRSLGRSSSPRRGRGSRVGKEVVTMPRPRPSSDPVPSACPASVSHSVAEGLWRGACKPCGCLGRQLPRPGRHRCLPSPARLWGSPCCRTHHSNPCQLAHKLTAYALLRSGLLRGGQTTGKRLPSSSATELQHLPPRATQVARGPRPLSSSSNPRGHARARRAPPDLYFPSSGAEFACAS